MLDKTKRYLVVGLGLLGGKYALELTKAGFHVDGINRSEGHLQYALDQGYIASGKTHDFEDLVQEADHIIFGLYPTALIQWFKTYGALLKPGCIFTDVSGVKTGLVEPVQALCPDGVEFIASHPMAGRETSSVEHAAEVNFAPANFIITPTEKNTPAGIAWAKELAEVLGFKHICTLTVEEHDKMIGYVSQLCHAIAVSLMCANDNTSLCEYTGDSFRDLTRIARINDKMWAELFLWNKENLISEIDQFDAALGALRNALVAGDREKLEEMFRLSTRRRAAFDKKLPERGVCMPKQEGQKSKLLALLRIFETQTDENHLLNVPQLVRLLEQQGILCERKSVYSDIDALNALGYEIWLRRGRGGGYYMASRMFDLAELKLLVDAVQASRVVSSATSRRLIRKLEKLCSNYEGSQLQRQVYVDGRPKTDSKSLLYSVDALHEAINAGKMVEFHYKKVGRPEKRAISPWQMAWENGCYYLIAYQDEKEPVGIRHYRVDKMSGVRVLDEPRRGKAEFADFDLPAYLKKHFSMYGGPEARVTLRCAAGLEDAMRERFGASPLFLPEEDGHFHFDVPICVSEPFYGWVAGFGGKVEITAPEQVRAGMKRLAEQLAKEHT